MANRKSRYAAAVKEKGWWPESWVPLLCIDGPYNGYTVPYDPKVPPAERVIDFSTPKTYPSSMNGKYEVRDLGEGAYWAWVVW
jgi:hypothetical protein